MAKKKGNRDFMGLTNTECVNVSKQILDNAAALYDDAKLLAGNKSYGRGTSMLIHCTEETMKALILFLDGNGFQFRRKVSGISNLFIHHKLRYGLAMLVSVLYIFSEDFKTLLKKIHKEPKRFKDSLEDKKQVGGAVLKYLQTKIMVIIQEVDWFSKAEYLRQEGFYVDFSDEIKSPLQISKQGFDAVLLRTNGMRNVVSGFIDAVESNEDEFAEHLDKLKQQFIDENWYAKIGSLIETYKNREVNPLDALSNGLTEFSTEINSKTDLDDLKH